MKFFFKGSCYFHFLTRVKIQQGHKVCKYIYTHIHIFANLMYMYIYTHTLYIYTRYIITHIYTLFMYMYGFYTYMYKYGIYIGDILYIFIYLYICFIYIFPRNQWILIYHSREDLVHRGWVWEWFLIRSQEDCLEP